MLHSSGTVEVLVLRCRLASLSPIQLPVRAATYSSMQASHKLHMGPTSNLDDAALPICCLSRDYITYTVTATKGDCNGTATVTITTYPLLPDPTIQTSGNTLICTGSPNYVSFQCITQHHS